MLEEFQMQKNEKSNISNKLIRNLKAKKTKKSTVKLGRGREERRASERARERERERENGERKKACTQQQQ